MAKTGTEKLNTKTQKPDMLLADNWEKSITQNVASSFHENLFCHGNHASYRKYGAIRETNVTDGPLQNSGQRAMATRLQMEQYSAGKFSHTSGLHKCGPQSPPNHFLKNRSSPNMPNIMVNVMIKFAYA